MKIVLNHVNAIDAGYVSKGVIITLALFLFLFQGCCTKSRKPGAIQKKSIKKNDKVTKLKNNRKTRDPQKKISGFKTTFELPGQNGPIRIVDSGFSEVVEALDQGEYGAAVDKIIELKKKYPQGTPQGEALQYLHADSLFGQTDLQSARLAYETFLKEYPNSPLKENVKRAIEFIDNIDRYKKMYVAPEKDKN